MSANFSEYVPEAIRAYFRHADLERPTLVQERSWRPALQGRDLVVTAPTGSGKTAVALMAILQAFARSVSPLIVYIHLNNRMDLIELNL